MMLVSKVFMGEYRPEFKNPIPDCYRRLIESCWAKNPAERPTFDQIVDQLKNNDEFITGAVDRDEYMNYIDFIEKAFEIMLTEPPLLMKDELIFSPPELFEIRPIKSINLNVAKSIDVYSFAFILDFHKKFLYPVLDIG